MNPQLFVNIQIFDGHGTPPFRARYSSMAT
jgi:hypothetical protein